MRIPSVGWAFFGLAVLVLIGYVLNKGILVGANVRQETMSSGDMYVKYCSYLHFGGVGETYVESGKQFEAVDGSVCPMFDH